MFIANREKWSTIRARGKRSYVIGTGIKKFGIGLGVSFLIPVIIFQETNWVMSTFITFVTCLLAGWLVGIVTWTVNEHEYKHHGQE